MYKYATLNPIAQGGLDRLSDLFEHTDNTEEADAILVRSAKMHDMTFSPNLKCIVRAGIGVNNIPVDKCAENGVVVFNTPGANANAVKELALSAMFIASRNILDATDCVKCNKGADDIAAKMEKEKKQFKGFELAGKKLGVIGLGAIGVSVANAAVSLGMEVYGYDPYVSVNSAWHLRTSVNRVMDTTEIFKTCDFITLHAPLLDSTKHTINKEAIDMMKDGVVIINYARDLLCDEEAVVEGLKSGKIKNYMSDFANEITAGTPGCIITPHIGASTKEAEDNSAIMACDEMQDFLLNGNINHSNNFSNCIMGVCKSKNRVTIIHKNITNMIAKFTGIFADNNINIDKMLNKSKGDYAYSMFDVDSEVSADAVKNLESIDGVVKVRVI